MPGSPERPRLRKWLRRIAATALVAACGLFLYACATQKRMRKEIAETPRDAVTQVAKGTEAITIPPGVDNPATSRTAVLMVHGFLAARTDFADLGERLAARGLTVRMMRLPGHGTTPVDFAYLPDGALYAAVRQEFLELEKEFDAVYAVGFSMGGALSTILASRQDVARLALVSPYFGVTYQWYYGLRPETWNRALGDALPYMVRPQFFIKLNKRENVGKFFFYGILPSSGVRQLTDLGELARSPGTLRNVTCPVLLVHSEGDEAASPARAKEAFAQMASTHKEALWVTRSNHIILWDYDAEAAMDRIEKFLLAPGFDAEASSE